MTDLFSAQNRFSLHQNRVSVVGMVKGIGTQGDVGIELGNGGKPTLHFVAVLCYPRFHLKGIIDAVQTKTLGKHGDDQVELLFQHGHLLRKTL